VENSATRRRRTTGSSASADRCRQDRHSCGAGRVPAASTYRRRAMSSPARRIHSPGWGTSSKHTPSPSGAHSFLHHHRVGAGGTGAPVKMRAAVPGASVWPTHAGGDALGHGQRCSAGRHIRATDGVAVHRGIVQRRHVDGGTQAGGQHPSGGSLGRHRFGIRRYPGARQQARQRVFVIKHS
jgi:hypothetical protein